MDRTKSSKDVVGNVSINWVILKEKYEMSKKNNYFSKREKIKRVGPNKGGHCYICK